MADVILFHHALGLTDGVRAFADDIRAAGHSVVTPDLYEGAIYGSIDDGVAHAERVGFEVIAERGAACAEGLADRFVVAGFSLGILPAQRLAQTRPDVGAAILYHDAVPTSTFGGGWPAGVDLQIHIVEDDEWADLGTARAVAAEAGGELFVYPGSAHLVADSSFGDYDETLAGLFLARTLAFLATR